MDLQKFIDGLSEKENIQPVPFSFHDDLGEAICSDESRIDSKYTKERTDVPNELIPFMP